MHFVQDTRPRSIIPVDLNAFLEKNARILSELAFIVLQDVEIGEKFKKISEEIRDGVQDVLWCEEDGCW